jgi:restriction system protein
MVRAGNDNELADIVQPDDFIRLLLEHYEDLDPEYKAQVPLRKVWVPAE